MIPLIVFPAVLLIATAIAGSRFVARQRPHPSSVVAVGLGLVALGTVILLAYRQGIIADETGGTPPSSTPLLIVALAGIALIALGAFAALRRPRPQ